MASIRDVAIKAGVGIGTVSRALNGSGYISDETKQKIMQAVEELKAIRARTGISIMGEGGEYESLTIDSPMHSRPLEIVSSEKDWSRQGGTMRVTSARLSERSA